MDAHHAEGKRKLAKPHAHISAYGLVLRQIMLCAVSVEFPFFLGPF
jgi:hypothetical protein